MGSRRKGTELVFNLKWQNRADNGGDKSNVIGMYDTPATTLNFETFKSYLLKNSGVVANDVKVIYLTDNGAEWVIDSQEWFEIALCAFRLKARLGEVIFLKLDMISGSGTGQRKHSNDVETQIDPESVNKGMEAPPEWFLSYMKQFKREVVEEVSYAVSSNLNAAHPKEKETAPPIVVIPRKIKHEPSRKSRRHIYTGDNPIDKEMLKTLKYDRKIESKLDKLDAKTKKIKEKKQALISKIDAGEEHHKHVRNAAFGQNGKPLMDAMLLSEPEVPHMVGGETYLHKWNVVNTGLLPWSSKTELRLTWGSAEMKPYLNAVSCPQLVPGEKGVIAVRFLIPSKPGEYESYWNFYDRDVRFGQWLSCSVIVDGPISSYQIAETTTSKKPKIDHNQQQKTASSDQQSVLTPEKVASPQPPKENVIIIDEKAAESEVEGAVGFSVNVMDLSSRLQKVRVVGVPPDSDSEWETVGEYGTVRKAKSGGEEKVEDGEEEPVKTNKYGINEKDLIVDLSKSKKDSDGGEPVEEAKVDSEEKEAEVKDSNDDNNNNGTSVNRESSCEMASEASDVSSGFDVITFPPCEENDQESLGYVYITIDGNKLPVPKHILCPEFLNEAEEAPGPLKSEDEEKDFDIDTISLTGEIVDTASMVPTREKTPEQEHSENIFKYTKLFMENIRNTAAGNRLSELSPGQHTRVFVFPQDNPGFEMLYYPKGLRGDGASQSEPTPPFDKIFYYPDGMKANIDEQKQESKEGGSPNKKEAKVTGKVPCSVVYPTVQDPEEGTNDGTKGKTPEPEVPPAPTTPSQSDHPPFTPNQGTCINNQSTFHQHVPNYQQSCHKILQRFKEHHAAQFAEQQERLAKHAGSTAPRGRPASYPHYPTPPTWNPTAPKPTTAPVYPGHRMPPLFTPIPEPYIPPSVYYPHCVGTQTSTTYTVAPPPPSNAKVPEQPPTVVPQQVNPTTPPIQQGVVPSVHILPENLVSGAVNVASSAINTAKSVISMIVPPKQEPGKWVNGHWISDDQHSPRAKNLCILAEMGFWDTDLNATLLARYNDDVNRVVTELLK